VAPPPVEEKKKGWLESDHDFKTRDGGCENCGCTKRDLLGVHKMVPAENPLVCNKSLFYARAQKKAEAYAQYEMELAAYHEQEAEDERKRQEEYQAAIAEGIRKALEAQQAKTA
jgi:hypothetical protein